MFWCWKCFKWTQILQRYPAVKMHTHFHLYTVLYRCTLVYLLMFASCVYCRHAFIVNRHLQYIWNTHQDHQTTKITYGSHTYVGVNLAVYQRGTKVLKKRNICRLKKRDQNIFHWLSLRNVLLLCHRAVCSSQFAWSGCYRASYCVCSVVSNRVRKYSHLYSIQ